MYSTKLLHKNMVDGNAYITIGDPYVEAKPNPFRQSKKSDKTPFRTKVIVLFRMLTSFLNSLFVDAPH